MRRVWPRRDRSTRPGLAVAPSRRWWWATGGVGLVVALLLVLLAGGGAREEQAAGTPPAQGARVAAGTVPSPQAEAGPGVRARGEVTLSSSAAPTVEELLAQGLALAGASPVQLAIRGTAAGASVRCAWRGIARSGAQRAQAIRFWLRLGADDPLPAADYLDVLFAVTLDTLDPEYRETAQANFRAIARGGLSEEYLFLTCFADYTVSAFLLGTGTTPTTVTVAYDRRDEAWSYALYAREHDTGTFGAAALKTPGEYAAGLQAQVRAAEAALRAEIGGREAVVFLAPLGAHHAIAYEAWQAVAQWAVVPDDGGVVQAVRDDTPAGDPEHTQPLATLTSRITTAAASDAHATTRVRTVGGLEGYYRTTLQAYGDITPGDGQTTPFTPQQPPPAPVCTNGTVVSDPANNRALVADCEVLLAAKDGLRGTAPLNWSSGTALSGWTGVTTGGTPLRVTGLNLASQRLTGTLPAQVGHLVALTRLNLSSNQLTGDIPAELGWLDHLTELRLSGNTLTGCIPLALQAVATHDLRALHLPYCAPPAPVNLRAGPPGEGSLVLSWDAVPNASTYAVEVWAPEGRRWRTASDTITGTTHTVSDLQCVTAYDLRVRAAGSGTGYAAAWGAPSAVLTATTGACTPPTFVGAPYTFTVSKLAAIGTAVGTVTATDAAGSAVTYGISDQSVAGTFAIDAPSGVLTVAGALDYATQPTHTLTVTATDASGGAATATVTITLTDATQDHDADDDGLIDVATLAQLNAIRWDLDGDGASSAAGYALAFPAALAGMGCPARGCTGYELTADLDFDTDGSGTVDAGDAYWAAGAGWVPIGTAGSPFAATFAGSGHTIANLVINRGTTTHVGLFGLTAAASVIRHVGLPDVDVRGDSFVGGLVGWNKGRIAGSYVTGRVAGTGIDIGGLVGWNEHWIATSYATAAVAGSDSDVGGLVGGNGSFAEIRASYARGAVTGADRVGGLAGYNGGRITASYARGAVTGAAPVGGLVALSRGVAPASYWDTTTSGQATSAGGTGQTTGALQAPTGYTGLYAAWNVDTDGTPGGDDPWDFGTARQYPVLRVDFDGDGAATWAEFGAQRNFPPVFAEGATTVRAVAENTAAGAPVGAPVTATDADRGDPLTYTLGGPDGARFALDADSGQVRTSAALDYETQAAYAVLVTVSDGQGGTASITVTISVEDVAGEPPAPPNLRATPAPTSVALTWDAVAGAAKYRVDYRTGDTETWTTAADTVTAPPYTVADLTCGTAYTFRVSAYGDGATHTAGWGAVTAPVAATTGACPLPAPPNLQATPAPTSVALTWDAVAGAAKYRVEYRPSDTETWTTAADTVTAPPYTVADLTCGTAYAFRVSAAGDGSTHTAGWGAVTAPVAATTGACPLPAPPNLQATPAPTSVALAWDAVPGAVKYRVEYRIGDTETWTTAADTVTAPPYTVTALTCGTAYAFQVSAAGDGRSYAADWGAATAPVAATTGTCPPPGPVTVAFGQAAYTVREGASVEVRVVLSAALAQAVTLALTTGGTAGTADTTGVPGSVTFAAGDTATSFQVTAVADAVADAGERLTLGFAERPAGIGEGEPAVATITIQEAAASPPVFAAARYAFSLAENAAVTTVVGTVAATAATAVTYAITAGNAGGAFTIDGASGALSVAGALDYETTPTYALTVAASADGATATVAVAITVTNVADTAPPAPTSLAAGTVTATSVPLTWAAVAGVAKYRVDYRASDTETWTTANDSLTGTTHTVAGLTCGTGYAFRVSAYGDGAAHTATWGAAATAVTATTGVCPLPAPPAPASLTAGTVTATSVALTWDAVTGAAKYRVEYRPSDTETWTTAADTVTATTHTVASLTCGTAYAFRVSAYGDGATHAADWGGRDRARRGDHRRLSAPGAPEPAGDPGGNQHRPDLGRRARRRQVPGGVPRQRHGNLDHRGRHADRAAVHGGGVDLWHRLHVPGQRLWQRRHPRGGLGGRDHARRGDHRGLSAPRARRPRQPHRRHGHGDQCPALLGRRHRGHEVSGRLPRQRHGNLDHRCRHGDRDDAHGGEPDLWHGLRVPGQRLRRRHDPGRRLGRALDGRHGHHQRLPAAGRPDGRLRARLLAAAGGGQRHRDRAPERRAGASGDDPADGDRRNRRGRRGHRRAGQRDLQPGRDQRQLPGHRRPRPSGRGCPGDALPPLRRAPRRAGGRPAPPAPTLDRRRAQRVSGGATAARPRDRLGGPAARRPSHQPPGPAEWRLGRGAGREFVRFMLAARESECQCTELVARPNLAALPARLADETHSDHHPFRGTNGENGNAPARK